MGEPDLACDMEELGVKLGSNLKLSEKERKGIVIERKDVEEALLRFQFCVVAEVLTNKFVHRDTFIDRFTSLWRGKNGVSVRDLGDRRFLARFVTEEDMGRVTEAEYPWTFKDDLVMVADRTKAGKNRWEPLTRGSFWMQLYNIPPLSMTRAVALAIGGLVGTVLKVDRRVSKECIGRLLRVNVRFNVKEQLMRGTYVRFPDEGMIWVGVKYEGLPNYCLICGRLGHPNQICKGNEAGAEADMEGEQKGDEIYAFKDLDATTDLRGNPLSSGSRKGMGSEESRGRRSSRSLQQSGNTLSFKVGSAEKIASSSGKSGNRHHRGAGGSGNERREDDVEVGDTASSPLKRKPNFSTESIGSTVAERIRARKERDENERKARERQRVIERHGAAYSI